MAALPPHPDFDQLRHQAKDLLRAARAGEANAVERIQAVSDQLTLVAAQLAIAREYGFSSWARLKTDVEAQAAGLAKVVMAFCEASIRDWTGRAARLLTARPEIADSGFAAAVLLGDAARVRAAIDHDPAIATRPDSRTGWTPLHAVCGSRWHRLDPARAEGLASVARMLLDAGADPNRQTPEVDRRPCGWTPLQCAVAGAANPAIVRLLLERGAIPTDDNLYLACFGGDDRESVRLLLDHLPNLAESTALSAPISIGDIEIVRLMLDAGVDPCRRTPADGYGAGFADHPPCPTVYGAVRSDCPAELVTLLLDHGADPTAPGPDGSSPYRLALRQGRLDLATLLRGHGAADDATDAERLLAACLRADRAAAQQQIRDDPGLPDRLTEADHAALVRAADTGNTAAVALMLDLGFPIEARGEDGGTALHFAAYAGSAGVARLLLARGADLEARDTTWHSTPVEWAKVGSGEKPRHNKNPDWSATVRALIEAGASLVDITLSPDDGKPPSPEVADLLRQHGATTTE